MPGSLWWLGLASGQRSVKWIALPAWSAQCTNGGKLCPDQVAAPCSWEIPFAISADWVCVWGVREKEYMGSKLVLSLDFAFLMSLGL